MGSGVVEAHVPWGGRDVLAAVGVTVGVLIILGIVTASALLAAGVGEEERWRLVAGLANTVVFDALVFAVAVRFTVRKYRCSWARLGFRWPRADQWWLVPSAVVAFYIVLAVYTVVIRALGFTQEAAPRSTLPQEIFSDPLLVSLGAVAAVLAAPLAEETFFRGFLFGALRSRWGLWWGVAGSAVLFALPHLDPGSIAPFTLIGVLLALIYAYSGSLWISISSHFIFNAVSFTIATIVGNGA